jgi:hypothetical protein
MFRHPERSREPPVRLELPPRKLEGNCLGVLRLSLGMTGK